MPFNTGGALGGAASGAALGTAFAPGIGTAIGAVGGAALGGFLGGGDEEEVKEPKLKGKGLFKQYKAVARNPSEPYFKPDELASIANRAEAPGRIGAVQEQKELAARSGGDTSSPFYQLAASQIEGNRASGAAQQMQGLQVENKQLGDQFKQQRLSNLKSAFNMRNSMEYQYPPLVPGAGGQGAGQAAAGGGMLGLDSLMKLLKPNAQGMTPMDSMKYNNMKVDWSNLPPEFFA